MIYSILALLLVILKLTGVVTWAWWIVLMPLWGPFVLVIGFILLLVIFLICVVSVIQVLEWIDK